MALSSTIMRTLYTSNGSNTTFAIPGTIIESDSSEVKVYKLALDGTVTLLSEGAVNPLDYQLTGANPPGTPFDTDVELNAAVAVNVKILVIRILEITQGIDVNSNSEVIAATTLEQGYDRLTAICQQLQEQLNRAIKLNITSADTDIELETPEEDMVLVGDADGNIVNGLSIATIEAAIAAAVTAAADAAAAAVSAAAALASQVAAAASQSAAASSASSASTSASSASTSATTASTAASNAQTAETNAELAETNAETAQAAAELAEANAELAETNAELAETNAEAAAVAADASADAALVSETNAAASAAAAAALGGPGADFTIANNASAQNVTGMTVDAATFKSAKVFGMIRRTTALPTDLAAFIEFNLYYDNATWRISGEQNHGEDVGVDFAITTSLGVGQVTYTSSNEAGGSYTGDLRWRMIKC
jgi:hypothetical protein